MVTSNGVSLPPDYAVVGKVTNGLDVVAADPDEPARSLEFRLLDNAPKGARIDPHTGEFQFSPVDAKPGELATDVVDRYLELKAAGRL